MGWRATKGREGQRTTPMPPPRCKSKGMAKLVTKSHSLHKYDGRICVRRLSLAQLGFCAARRRLGEWEGREGTKTKKQDWKTERELREKRVSTHEVM
jgi:hypothetical protein